MVYITLKAYTGINSPSGNHFVHGGFMISTQCIKGFIQISGLIREDAEDLKKRDPELTHPIVLEDCKDKGVVYGEHLLEKPFEVIFAPTGCLNEWVSRGHGMILDKCMGVLNNLEEQGFKVQTSECIKDYDTNGPRKTYLWTLYK